MSTKKENKLSKQVREKAFGYILAGFGLVAGLAWNDAIKEAITLLYPLEQDSLVAKFIYAGVMTIVVVIVSLVLLKGSSKKK